MVNSLVLFNFRKLLLWWGFLLFESNFEHQTNDLKHLDIALSQQIEELASCLEAVIFIIKLDISRFGVKGPALRIELVSKHKISVFNPRGMHQQEGRSRVAHLAVLHGLYNVRGRQSELPVVSRWKLKDGIRELFSIFSWYTVFTTNSGLDNS